MPRQRGAPARGQELEAVIEQDGYFLRSQHDRTRRGELDRKRDAVETAADRDDGAEILLVRGKFGPSARARAMNNCTAVCPTASAGSVPSSGGTSSGGTR